MAEVMFTGLETQPFGPSVVGIADIILKKKIYYSIKKKIYY